MHTRVFQSAALLFLLLAASTVTSTPSSSSRGAAAPILSRFAANEQQQQQQPPQLQPPASNSAGAPEKKAASPPKRTAPPPPNNLKRGLRRSPPFLFLFSYFLSSYHRGHLLHPFSLREKGLVVPFSPPLLTFASLCSLSSFQAHFLPLHRARPPLLPIGPFPQLKRGQTLK